MGRGTQPPACSPSTLEELAERIREAVASGDLAQARELVDEADRSCKGTVK